MATLLLKLIKLIILFCIKYTLSDIPLDIGNGDISSFYTMTCQSSYCSNTTIFTFNPPKTCHSPLLTVHFRLTDFSNTKLQYLTITLNQQSLGKCTGPNNATFHANYDTTSIPLYTDCLNDFNIAELVGYNPTQINLQLTISPHVTDTTKSYQNNLLYAQVAFGCSASQTKQITSQEWDPSLPVPANTNLQCIQSGCHATAHFIILQPELCHVPLLSLQFWLTDFDQDYEYLTVEINNEYLGICEGGKQMEINTNLLTAQQQDLYWNEYIYQCFRNIDISRYTGIEPEEIEIKLILQETVDRNWLDLSPTPYLLDAIIKMDCGEKTQDEIISGVQTYDRTRHSNYYGYPHELKIQCQEVECGGLWQWKILGHCQYPILSLYYYTQHYDDSMIEILINEKVFGHCGPIDDTGGELGLATQYNVQNVRTCFEGLELYELIGGTWNSRSDFNGNPDAISNSFEFGFAITEIDELDGILNGSVAQLFINLDCQTESNIKNNELVHITASNKDLNGFSYAESELNCVYAGCTSKLTFTLDIGHNECIIPKLDLYFWLTDFGIQNEFIEVIINNHLYGWCDGGKDKYFDDIYQCLYKADIQEWVDWEINGNIIELVLNASSFVDGLDTNKNGFLMNAKARLTCYNSEQYNNKIKKMEIFPNNEEKKSQTIPIECQGVGCFTYLIFTIRDNICYEPKLSVKFWLSDFSTFDEYVSIGINGNELQKCRGGNDQDFDEIYTCFEGKDIRYMFQHEYNNELNDFNEYYIGINEVLNVSLQMSETSLWLDHSYNYSILDGIITLQCEPENVLDIGNDDDIIDNDNDTFRFLEMRININKVTDDIITMYFNELVTRFEYSLDATIHFEENKSDRIPFTIESKIIIIDPKQVSDFIIYISTLSHQNVKQIKRIIEMDIFLFIFQETLRDSHFKNSILESISDLKILTNIPMNKQNNIAININTTTTNLYPTNDNNSKPESESDSSNSNFLRILFTDASVTDWLSFIGVIFLCILLCFCCIGSIAFICISQQKNKTRKEILKYKQTNIGDSETDYSDDNIHACDEMKGMLNISSKESHKSVSIYKNVKMVNRANNLKDKIQRHHSQSGIISQKKTKKYNSKKKNKRRISNSYSHSIVSHSQKQNEQILHPIQMTESQNINKIAIHPALSTAIDTVNKMNNLKTEQMAATHGLVVSSSIIEEMENTSSSESLPSGIDLSEEFINYNHDIEVSIDINDIDDINEIQQKQHKRNKSKNKNKKYKNKKYKSIGNNDNYNDSEELSISVSDNNNNKVFGMKIVNENTEQSMSNKKNIQPTKHIKNKSSNIPSLITKFSDNELSDDLSSLSDSGLREQSLNSLTHEFSQMI